MAAAPCVAVAPQVNVADSHLFGALARAWPFRRRRRQRLFTRGQDLQGAAVFGKRRVAPRGRQETLYKRFVPPFLLGPALSSLGFDDLSANPDKVDNASPLPTKP